MSYSLKSAYCHGWKKIIMKETVIFFSYKIGARWKNASRFCCCCFKLLPYLKNQPAHSVANSLCRGLPYSFQGAAVDGTTATWPPSTRGGNPGGHVLKWTRSRLCGTGFWNDRREPGSFPSSCDSGSRPPSLLLTRRGVNLCCLKRHGTWDFAAFLKFFILFLKVLSGWWWFLDKREIPTFYIFLSKDV